MQIRIHKIPHNEQRYETCGDWFYDRDGDLQIYVSDLQNEKMESLVAVHELIEALSCRFSNINEQDVTDFDLAFETLRSIGKVPEHSEPGDFENAPYHTQHEFATKIEGQLAQFLGVDWMEYDNKINSLKQTGDNL